MCVRARMRLYFYFAFFIHSSFCIYPRTLFLSAFAIARKCLPLHPYLIFPLPPPPHSSTNIFLPPPLSLSLPLLYDFSIFSLLYSPLLSFAFTATILPTKIYIRNILHLLFSNPRARYTSPIVPSFVNPLSRRVYFRIYIYIYTYIHTQVRYIGSPINNYLPLESNARELRTYICTRTRHD